MSWSYSANEPITLKMPVAVNAAGNIAQEGETAVSQKLLYFPNWRVSIITNATAGTVIEAFASEFVGDILGANYDMLNSKITVDYVAEET